MPTTGVFPVRSDQRTPIRFLRSAHPEPIQLLGRVLSFGKDGARPLETNLLAWATETTPRDACRISGKFTAKEFGRAAVPAVSRRPDGARANAAQGQRASAPKVRPKTPTHPSQCRISARFAGALSDERGASQHQPIEEPPLVHVVIGIRLMHDAAIIPDHHITGAPPVAVFVFLLRRMAHQFFN